MEDSRKGKRSGKKGLSTPDPHVYGGNGKKAMVYNTKRKRRKGDKEKERERKKKRKKKRLEYSQIIVLGHVRGYFLYRYMRITLSF